MTEHPKNFKDLSLAYEELNTRYGDLSSRFRAMRNTLSNKYQENILADLESKTLELQELSEKLNLSDESKKRDFEAVNEGKIKQMESLIDFQKRRINGLEREKTAFQSDIHSLTLELKEKQEQIDFLAEKNKGLLENSETKQAVKSVKKNFFKSTPKGKRSSTVDILMLPSHQEKHSSNCKANKLSVGKFHKPKGFEIYDPERVQEELEFPLPRPRSPHPAFFHYSDQQNDEGGILSKSLPVSPTSPVEEKVLNI